MEGYSVSDTAKHSVAKPSCFESWTIKHRYTLINTIRRRLQSILHRITFKQRVRCSTASRCIKNTRDTSFLLRRRAALDPCHRATKSPRFLPASSLETVGRRAIGRYADEPRCRPFPLVLTRLPHENRVIGRRLETVLEIVENSRLTISPPMSIFPKDPENTEAADLQRKLEMLNNMMDQEARAEQARRQILYNIGHCKYTTSYSLSGCCFIRLLSDTERNVLDQLILFTRLLARPTPALNFQFALVSPWLIARVPHVFY